MASKLPFEGLLVACLIPGEGVFFGPSELIQAWVLASALSLLQFSLQCVRLFERIAVARNVTTSVWQSSRRVELFRADGRALVLEKSEATGNVEFCCLQVPRLNVFPTQERVRELVSGVQGWAPETRILFSTLPVMCHVTMGKSLPLFGTLSSPNLCISKFLTGSRDCL